MKISAQAKVIRDGVADWARTRNGSVEIALDLNHLFALLSIKPGGFRAAVIWDRQEKRGEHEEASMVDNFFRVYLSFGRNLKLEKGSALTDGAEGGAPFADLIEELRDTLRGLAAFDDSTEQTLDFKGAWKATDAHPELLVDSWYCEVSLGGIIP